MYETAGTIDLTEGTTNTIAQPETKDSQTVLLTKEVSVLIDRVRAVKGSLNVAAIRLYGELQEGSDKATEADQQPGELGELRNTISSLRCAVTRLEESASVLLQGI